MSHTDGQRLNHYSMDREWVALLDGKARLTVIHRLLQIIASPKSRAREVTSAASALARFDALDIERAKLDMVAERDIAPEPEDRPFVYRVLRDDSDDDDRATSEAG